MSSPQYKRPPGRPDTNQEDAREALLIAARECFSERPFREVTTRVIAQKAGVNAALIRYYFLNKEGLYQQMLASVADEFQAVMLKHTKNNDLNPFEAILRAHCELALANPNIPKLLFKEIVYNDGEGREQVIKHVAQPNKLFMTRLVEDFLKQQKIRADFDPVLLVMSAMSISLMPHLIRPVFEQLEGVQFDQAFFDKLIWQNAQLIQFGCMQRDDKPSPQQEMS